MRKELKELLANNSTEKGVPSWHTLKDIAPYLARRVIELEEALDRCAKLASIVTVKQCIEAGDEYINAAGLNPYCMNEGLAEGDEKISIYFVEKLLED